MSPEPVVPDPGKAPDVVLTVGVNAGPALASLDRMQRALDAAQAPPSPAFSFKGWLFGTWLVKNKGMVKLLLTLFFAWVAYLLSGVQSPELKALLVGAVGFLSKFGLDLLDYYLTPQPEAKPQ